MNRESINSEEKRKVTLDLMFCNPMRRYDTIRIHTFFDQYNSILDAVKKDGYFHSNGSEVDIIFEYYPPSQLVKADLKEGWQE